MQPARSTSYRSWLVGELVLVSLLGVAALSFASLGSLGAYGSVEALHGRVVLDTVVAVLATMVAILASVRFLVEGRLLDLFLAAGFLAAGAGTFALSVAPVLVSDEVRTWQAWAAVGCEILAACAIAAAPFITRRVSERRRALALAAGATLVAVAGVAALARSLDDGVSALPGPDDARTASATLAFASLAALALAAAIGFGLRFRHHGRDLDSWLALALTLIVFAELHYVITPALSGAYLLHGDFLRLTAYGVLLVGVWRAITHAEFGRAVAEERARVAREIHDGLAQYLFAISAQVSMLESGARLEQVLPRLKQAATAAQQEARFAILALSSAGGTAPFDAALRRYVDFLTADGALEVEVDIDPGVRLAADEQIELFRIVQEGLANARRHADARRAEVVIEQRGGRRVVEVRDDGSGFEERDAEGAGGQGLRNMRLRAESIEGAFALRSVPGQGTAIEIVLRAA